MIFLLFLLKLFFLPIFSIFIIFAKYLVKAYIKFIPNPKIFSNSNFFTIIEPNTGKQFLVKLMKFSLTKIKC